MYKFTDKQNFLFCKSGSSRNLRKMVRNKDIKNECLDYYYLTKNGKNVRVAIFY